MGNLSARIDTVFIVFTLAHGASALAVAVLGTETKGSVLEEIEVGYARIDL